jgi:hypothetical protein
MQQVPFTQLEPLEQTLPQAPQLQLSPATLVQAVVVAPEHCALAQQLRPVQHPASVAQLPPPAVQHAGFAALGAQIWPLGQQAKPPVALGQHVPAQQTPAQLVCVGEQQQFRLMEGQQVSCPVAGLKQHSVPLAQQI